jgi:hypothetical protein
MPLRQVRERKDSNDKFLFRGERRGYPWMLFVANTGLISARVKKSAKQWLALKKEGS